MRKLLVVFIMSLLTISCQDIEMPERPDNLIDRETFSEILVDTYLSNAARNKSYQDIQEQNVRLEKYIYQKYGIDSLQFAKSNAYYSSDLDGYFKILQEVEQKLIELKGEEDPDVELDGDVMPRADKNIDRGEEAQ
ncbi:MAG TPA: DUF4296 domain-containing protein [Flavobacteriaceae bacterium]|nr:DUF4296 domain-containing protein [Flavobacteriaceae bacterium]